MTNDTPRTPPLRRGVSLTAPLTAPHPTLSTMARPSLGRPWRRTVTQVIARDPNCQLQLPGCTGRSQTADHIQPRSHGGPDTPNNLRGACHHCNQHRSNNPDPATDTNRASRNWTQP